MLEVLTRCQRSKIGVWGVELRLLVDEVDGGT